MSEYTPDHVNTARFWPCASERGQRTARACLQLDEEARDEEVRDDEDSPRSLVNLTNRLHDRSCRCAAR